MRLRSNLVALVVVSAVPILAFGVVTSTLVVRHEQDNFIEALKGRNRAFMSAVDAELRGHVATLQALAALRTLQVNDLRAFHSEAVAALATQRDWENLVLSGPDGAQLVNAAVKFGDPLPTDTDRGSAREVVSTGRPLVVSLRRRPLTNTEAIPVRVPVAQDGKVAYVLTAVVRPETFERLIRAQNLPESWITGLVDDQGRFIARVPPRPVGSAASPAFIDAIASAAEGWYRGSTVEGADAYTAYLRSDYTRWAIGLAIPADVVLAGSRRAAWWTLTGAGLCLLAAFALAMSIGRRITTPIGSLASQVKRLDEDIPIAVHTDIDEVHDLTVAMNAARESIAERRDVAEQQRAALEKADRAKDEFLAMLSHELRNPLAAITTSAQIMKFAVPGSDVAKSAQGIIERQTQQVTKLIEDLLDVSRIVMGKASLSMQPVDLGDLVSRCVSTWQASGRLSQHAVDVSCTSAWVLGDRTRIEQVVSNLLDNAVKFSPAGTPIEVMVRRKGAEVEATVSDRGSGIASGDLEDIFGLFVQGPQDLSRAKGGLGVGLAIVRRILELHGGRIAARSDGHGRGSRFIVTLPAIEPPPRPAPAREPVPSVVPKRVLLVEDNADARTALVDLLVLLGFDVESADSAKRGVQRALEWRPDFIVLDIGLPDMSGYDAARALRASGCTSKLIALTGYGQDSDKRKALDAGFDHHVTKPVSFAQLQELLAQDHGDEHPGDAR